MTLVEGGYRGSHGCRSTTRVQADGQAGTSTNVKQHLIQSPVGHKILIEGKSQIKSK